MRPDEAAEATKLPLDLPPVASRFAGQAGVTVVALAAAR